MASFRCNLTTVNGSLPHFIDLFVCAAGFEVRSTAIPLRIDRSRIKRALISTHSYKRSGAADVNQQRLQNHFNGKAELLDLRYDEPLLSADSMNEAFSRLGRAFNIVIDVTSFTHEMLLILMKVVSQWAANDAKVFCVYCGASEYSLGASGSDKWLTQGVKEVRSVLGYVGTNYISRRDHLMILAGFEIERAERIVEYYEPSVLSIGHGDQDASVSSSHYDLNLMSHQRLISTYQNVETFTFSCTDPEDTQHAIEAQIAKFADLNVIIAPLNTKLSTLGAGAAAIQNSDIQLCYASVATYNERSYSRPSEICYVTEISPWLFFRR